MNISEKIDIQLYLFIKKIGENPAGIVMNNKTLLALNEEYKSSIIGFDRIETPYKYRGIPIHESVIVQENEILLILGL